mmetsp:Transcript_16451/g.28189  ORF Transcript_16451/g.28189 Transcript_16451/m.28189 type:complete len:205 (+) Transcript_16451:2369-2983(+)
MSVNLSIPLSATRITLESRRSTSSSFPAPNPLHPPIPTPFHPRRRRRRAVTSACHVAPVACPWPTTSRQHTSSSLRTSSMVTSCYAAFQAAGSLERSLGTACIARFPSRRGISEIGTSTGICLWIRARITGRRTVRKARRQMPAPNQQRRRIRSNLHRWKMLFTENIQNRASLWERSKKLFSPMILRLRQWQRQSLYKELALCR